jgi:hypothetical protein
MKRKKNKEIKRIRFRRKIIEFGIKINYKNKKKG